MALPARRRHVFLLGFATLMAGCGSVPVAPAWSVAPLQRVAHAGGDQAAALYRVGRYHQQRGETAAAAEAFARSIALRPDQLDARNAQAVLLADQGRQAEASALLEQLVAAYPGEAQPMNNLGYLYYLQGRPQQARTLLAEALRIDPAHAQARANLARLTPEIAVPAAAAPAAAAAHAAASDTPTPSHLQLVQLAPNEFSLQDRVMTAAAQTPAAANEAAALRPMGPYPAQAKAPARRRADATHGAPGPLQIVNGNGIRGLGERTRRLLARVDGLGAAKAEVVNKRRNDQRDTIIEYLPGQRERARLLHTALPGRATLLAVRSLPRGLTLRVVLGHDYANTSARLRAAARAEPAPHFPGAPLLATNTTAVPHFTQE